MKAVVVAKLGPPSGLELREWPEPTPGPGQVVVQVAVSGVNFADVNARRGQYPHRLPPLPFVPGLEVAGTIVALGEGVTDLKVGQRVAALPEGVGSYAEKILASAALCFPIPDALGWEQAGAFPIITLTAYHLLVTGGHIQPGETVLMHAAAGGVGSVLIQLARILGAGKIFGTAGSDDKCEYARSLGADEAINYREGDFGERVLAGTGGKGVDLVFDAVGGATRARSLEVLAPQGRLVMFGNASGEKELSVVTTELREKSIGVVGFNLTSFKRHHPEVTQQSAQKILGWMTDGKLKVDVTEVFPLANAAAAHEHLEGRASRGKLLLQVGAS